MDWRGGGEQRPGGGVVGMQHVSADQPPCVIHVEQTAAASRRVPAKTLWKDRKAAGNKP